MRLQFIPVTETEIGKAKKLDKSLILKRTKPDYPTTMKDNCLNAILTKHETESCETKYMQIQDTIWLQLHTGNQWIGIVPKSETLHILCSDAKPRHVEISKNFILTLEPADCTGISVSATLKPNNILFNNSDTHQIIFTAIKTPIINTSETDIPRDLMRETHINEDNIQTIGKTLDELQDLTDKIMHHNRLKTWRENFFEYLHYAGYAALSALLFVFLHKIGIIRIIIQTLKQLLGNCYHHCSFNNQAPTRHVSYTASPQIINKGGGVDYVP